MKRLRRLALAGSLLAATACAPKPGQFKTIPLTDIVLMNKATFQDRNQKIANLEALVDLFFIRMGSENTGFLLRSLGIENPTREDHEKINNVVSLKKIIRQVTSTPSLKPDLQKKEVEKNFLDVNGGAGGILLSSDGMFITVHHATEENNEFYVVYNSNKYKASCIVYIQGMDVALCRLQSFYSNRTPEINLLHLMNSKKENLSKCLAEFMENHIIRSARFMIRMLTPLFKVVRGNRIQNTFLQFRLLHIQKGDSVEAQFFLKIVVCLWG